MIAHKFRGRLDRRRDHRRDDRGGAPRPGRRARRRSASTPRTGRAPTTGSCWSSRSRRREAGADRVRYCDTIGGDSPGRIRERFAKLASAVGMPVETHCHNDLGMAVANSVSGALGDLDAGQDAWVNTCVNGIGERSGNADLLSCILAFSHAFGVAEHAADRRPARPVLGPPVRAVGQLRVRPAAAAEPARHRAERVRPRVRHPRRRRAEGPAELRAVRRRHAGPVPGRLVRHARAGSC